MHTLHLFPELDQLLISCLQTCTTEDWDRPTLAGNWTIKDLAAHLLDVNLRSLSNSRDGFFDKTAPAFNSYTDLVLYLNQLNADWVKACRRVSPVLLIQLLETSNKAYYEHLLTLDPMAKAIYSVAWAGEETSTNTFHIAREYTEKWHHQQQIRLALGQEAALLEKHVFYPCISTFLMGLPHAYRNSLAPEGTWVHVHIESPAGGDWLLVRQAHKWLISAGNNDSVKTTTIILPPDIAWKLFTKGINSDEAWSQSRIQGNPDYAFPLFSFLGVMA